MAFKAPATDRYFRLNVLDLAWRFDLRPHERVASTLPQRHPTFHSIVVYNKTTEGLYALLLKQIWDY